MDKIVVGITGASGSIYGKRIIEALSNSGIFTYVCATDNGRRVFEYELCQSLEAFVGTLQNVSLEDNANLFSPIASGSTAYRAVVIAPCSMSTLSAIAQGGSNNLLTRVADVALKEGRQLLLVPRETPLNAIHLQNMLSLCNAGAAMLPAMPAFYHMPQSVSDMVDFVAGKALSRLGVQHNLFKSWEDMNAN